MALKKWLTYFVLITGITTVSSQNFSKTWNQYFSYLDISALDQSEEKVYAAAENAIFTYDKTSQDIETISSIQGLSGDKISSILYLDDNDLLFVGFENGLIQVYNETTKDVLNVVDIIDKPTILPNRKRINDFYRLEETIYISTDFGISEYNIDNLEFGDTFFIGNNGAQIKVNEITFFEDYLYAATESGIRRALANNPNLIDYQQWQTASGANFLQIETVGQKLYTGVSNQRVFEITFPGFIEKELFNSSILNMSNFNNKLTITTKNQTKIKQEDFTQIATFQASNYNTSQFSNAIISENDEVFIGTRGIINIGQEGYGLLKSTVQTNDTFEEIHPSGPILNRIFQFDLSGDQIWAVHGSFAGDYGFSGGVVRSGVSRFINNEWKNIPYSTIVGTVPNNPFFANNIIINKFNSNKAFLSTYYLPGLIEFENENIIQVYDETNSSLEKFVNVFYLLMVAAYDETGNLWITNGRVDKPLNRFKDGIWEGISLSSVITGGNNRGYSDIAFDQSGNVFLGSANYGVISYNVNTNEVNNIQDDENNMPSNDIRALSTDLNNQIWIGSTEGLRIIYNPEEFANGSPEVESIIFLEDGLGSELFFQQYINDIEVDGSNNKWIGTIDNGVFYLTSDGQKTIYHFTTDNSPLPSNDILDIKINPNTGEVFFATESGMVSFKGTSSKPQETLEDAYVYPNPVRPEFNLDLDKIKITGLSENVNLKITDIEGNLVNEAESKSNGKFKGFNLEIDGGTALWNGKNLANKKVASGVYVILINDLESFESKVLKVMIVRQ